MVENTINEGYAEVSEKYIVTVQQSFLVSNALSYKTVEPAGRIFQLKILRIQHILIFFMVNNSKHTSFTQNN